MKASLLGCFYLLNFIDIVNLFIIIGSIFVFILFYFFWLSSFDKKQYSELLVYLDEFGHISPIFLNFLLIPTISVILSIQNDNMLYHMHTKSISQLHANCRCISYIIIIYYIYIVGH